MLASLLLLPPLCFVSLSVCKFSKCLCTCSWLITMMRAEHCVHFYQMSEAVRLEWGNIWDLRHWSLRCTFKAWGFVINRVNSKGVLDVQLLVALRTVWDSLFAMDGLQCSCSDIFNPSSECGLTIQQPSSVDQETQWKAVQYAVSFVGTYEDVAIDSSSYSYPVTGGKSKPRAGSSKLKCLACCQFAKWD